MHRDPHLRAPGAALTHARTKALEALLRALYREEASCPLTTQELTRVGLQYAAEDLMPHLRGLDMAGTRAVIVAVLAERKIAERVAAEAAAARD